MNDQLIPQQKTFFRLTRKQLLLFFGLLVLIFIMWFWHFLNNPEQFPIKTVKVYGQYQHASKEKIKKIVFPLIAQGLFAVKIKKIQSELLQLPWISHVEVERIWPSELMITLHEKQPIAIWNKTGLVTESGKLFYPEQNSFPNNLPRFYGADGEQQSMLATYHQLSKIIAPLGLHIIKLRLTSDMLWRMRLNNGMDVMIGGQNLDERVEKFAQVYNKVFADKRQAKAIDLRYPNGLAVKWSDI